MKTTVYYCRCDNPGIAEFNSKCEAEEYESYVRGLGFLTSVITDIEQK